MRGRAGVAQRIIDHRQHALQISIDFIVPETQYREASAGEVIVALRIAPRMRSEIMLTASTMRRCLRQTKSMTWPSRGACRIIEARCSHGALCLLRFARDVGAHEPIVRYEKDHPEAEIPERERIEKAS